MHKTNRTIIYVVNVDWFFISHRLPLAVEAKKRGYHVVIATTNTGRFNELKDLGFTLFDLKINRSGTNPLNEILSIFKLIRILRFVKPDVIHNVTLKMSIYSSIASYFVKDAKVINAISGLGYNFTANRKTNSQRIIGILKQLAFKKRGFTFIFQNPDDYELFKKLKYDIGNKLVIIKGAGVDLNIFKKRERILTNEIRFILTARMLKDKGISEFISASKLVTSKYSKAKFLLVGDIDTHNPATFTENQLKEQLNGTNVTWLGHRNDILELLNDSDIMVFPSYREGLPKSLIEAAAVGLPIITTNTIGCKECVDNEVNGYLVPVGDDKTLAEKMIYLIEHPDLIIKMGIASRLKAENEFSLETVINKTFELYD